MTSLPTFELERNQSLWENQAGGKEFIGYDAAVSSQRIVDSLREECDVFLVAGSWFGMEGYLRIGIGVEPEVLRQGLDRIRPTLGGILGGS